APHPQIWVTGSSDLETPRRCAERGYVFANFLLPHDKVKPLFDTYRKHFVEHGLPGGGGCAYMPLVHVADSDSEADKGAEELRWYLTAPRAEPHFRNPPGYMPVIANVKAMRATQGPNERAARTASLDWLRDQGILISGTPDNVVKQIKRFYDLVGGFDHLLMMDHAGFMEHERTVKAMKQSRGSREILDCFAPELVEGARNDECLRPIAGEWSLRADAEHRLGAL